MTSHVAAAGDAGDQEFLRRRENNVPSSANRGARIPLVNRRLFVIASIMIASPGVEFPYILIISAYHHANKMH